MYRLLLTHFITQTLHQVTGKGSGHSRLLREGRDVEPGTLVLSRLSCSCLCLCVKVSVEWTCRWILLWRWNIQTLKVDVPGVFFSSCIQLFSSTDKDPPSSYLCSSVVCCLFLFVAYRGLFSKFNQTCSSQYWNPHGFFLFILRELLCSHHLALDPSAIKNSFSATDETCHSSFKWIPLVTQASS